MPTSELERPEEPESGLYDLFFDKFGFIRKIQLKCDSCGAWYEDGKYSAHCDPRDSYEN